MPKTGYVLSEREVARIHNSLDKVLKEVALLKLKFPIPPAPSTDTILGTGPTLN